MDYTLKVKHDWGFFSNCTIRLLHTISFNNQYFFLPKIDSSQQWNLYKDTSDKDLDVTNYFFKTDFKDLEEKIDSYELGSDIQYVRYNTLNYNILNKYVNKYFDLSDEILNIKNLLINKYNINPDEIISVCYRGNDKAIEINLPTYDTMLNKLIEIKEKYPNHKILIQSDEIQFYEFIEKTYPDIIKFDEIIKINHNEKLCVRDFIPDGYRKRQAQIFLSIMSILSETNQVILNTGNVGLWICLLRGNSIGVYQEYGGIWIE